MELKSPSQPPSMWSGYGYGSGYGDIYNDTWGGDNNTWGESIIIVKIIVIFWVHNCHIGLNIAIIFLSFCYHDCHIVITIVISA